MLADLPIRGVRDRVLLLRSLPSFAPLDDDSLTLMAEHARIRSFRRGEHLVVESEPIQAINIVINGEVRVTYQGELVAIVGRSRGVGMLALFSGQSSGTGATAVVDTTTLEVPVEAVLVAYEESFPIVRNALRLTAGGLLDSRGNLPAVPDPNRVVDEGEPTDRSLTLVERVLTTRNAPLLRRVNLEAVIELVRRGREVRYAAGERVWDLDEPSDFQLRLDFGRIRCTAKDGKFVDVGAGFVLGSLDSLAMSPRSFSAVAVKPTMAFRTDLQAWLGVMETHHELARGLLGILASALLDEQRAAYRKKRQAEEALVAGGAVEAGAALVSPS